MKKMFKKSIAMLIAVLMVISVMPITALASDKNLEIKTNVKIAGYENQYGLMYYNTGNKVDYILSVIKEANSDGVITVKKGSNLTVTQSFGTWTNVDNSAAGDTNIASNGLKWHYGNGTDYAIASVLNHDNKANNWNAYISGDTSKAIQSSVGGTMANKSVQNSLRSTSSEGAVNEATGIYTMTPETFPQLNTPGEYKIDLWSTVSLMNWKYNFPTTRWCSIYGTQNPVTITVRVVDDYTFEKANGNKTIISDISKDNALKKAPALDSDTKKIPNNDGTHSWTEYSWVETSESYFKETGATRNGQCNYGAETSETVTEPTCNKAGLKKYTKTCTECGHKVERTEEIPATGNHNYGTPVSVGAKQHKYVCSVCGDEKFEDHDIVDGKCTKCDYVPLDLSTYNAAITEADGIIANSDGKYTADSVNAYKAAVDTAKAKTYSTQKEIDAIISEIQSAQTLLQKARVTITFVVEKEDGSGTITETPIPSDWGQTVPLDTHSNYVSKWTIDVNGVTSKIDSNATAIDHVATENATIKAYVTDEQPDTKYSKVTFLGKNSAVVGVYYVESGKTVATTDLMEKAPEVPFYDASGWDRDTIVADGSDFTVKATYTAKSVNENKCNVHFNGTDKQYAYDSYVYLFNADKSKKYAMYADAKGNELITYLGGVDFSVPRRDDIYIKEVNANEMKAAIGFSGSYQQGLKSSFNVKFWLPEDATLIETGVDLVAKFPDGTVKSAHDRATKFNARNEYTYTASFSNSKKTVEFKPYLTYLKDGEKTTVYGTPQTVEFN